MSKITIERVSFTQVPGWIVLAIVVAALSAVILFGWMLWPRKRD